MRHDPASAALVIMLKSLKMAGMAQAISELTEQGSPAFEAAVPILSQLLKAEMAERETRSIAYQLKVARFPTYKDLTGFDFSSSEVNEALVRQLHAGSFIDKCDNVVLVGGPGTGKTHIATALAFVSDLSDVIERHQPKLWIHGHTHTRFDYDVGATRVVCNPRGYHHEQDYDPEMVIELGVWGPKPPGW